ncbi:MAG: hypothetical protein ACYDER_04660 [Ktedonobacteraceae bacterium]
MTRDFNKQRRDDMRPSSREQSSSRNGDERSPRPARPRLNRESVDRAWESGAPSHHADYRTRSNNGNRGQASRNDWRNARPSGQFGQNSQGGQYPARNSRPSYGDRPGNGPSGPHRFDNTSNGNHGYQSNQRPPSRPFNGNRPDRPDRPYGNSRPDSAPRGNGGRPEYREHSRPYEPRPSYRPNEQGGGFQRRSPDFNERPERNGRYEHNERGPRQFERNNYGNASNYNGRPSRPPQSFNRDRQAPGNNYRDTRSPRDAETQEIRDTQNPRWQSRPAAQRDSVNRREQNDGQFQPGQPGRERYKGDYERFNGAEDKPRFAGRPSLRYEKSKPRRPEAKKPQPEVEERHVTPLPDGRVLKGPRPVQRKNAEFWTGIAQNTNELLNTVKEVPTPQEQAADGSTVEHVLPTNNSPEMQLLPTDSSTEALEMPTNDSPETQILPTSESVEAQKLPTNDSPDVQTLQVDSGIEAQKLPTNDSPDVQEQTVAEEGTQPAKAKPRNRATSAAARSKKVKDAQAKTSGPQPSKRGFKWPTP